jgi:MRG-binding protein
MPPRKKARGSTRAASTPVPDDDSIMADAPTSNASPSKASYDILKDPWTDEQETSLFKGIMRWKPAGACLVHGFWDPN